MSTVRGPDAQPSVPAGTEPSSSSSSSFDPPAVPIPRPARAAHEFLAPYFSDTHAQRSATVRFRQNSNNDSDRDNNNDSDAPPPRASRPAALPNVLPHRAQAGAQAASDHPAATAESARLPSPEERQDPKRVLVVLAHPDDESLFSGSLRRLLAQGIHVDVVYLTKGNGGTMFSLSSKGIPEPKYDATGKEETDPQAYGRIRVKETVGFWKELGGNSTNLTVTVMDNPDFNPFRVARNTVDYGIKASWDRRKINELLEEKLANHEYAAILTTSTDPRIHPAHDKASRIAHEAARAFAATHGGNAPPVVEAVEEGWYALRDMVPLDPANTIQVPLETDEIADEFALRRAALQTHYASQPPGHDGFFGNARSRELLRLPEGLSAAQDASLRELFVRSQPADQAAADAARSANAGAESAPVTEIAVAGGERGLVETVPAAADLTRPEPSGPATAEELEDLMDRALRLARGGTGRRPHRITEVEEAQWFFLTQAGPRYVPPRTPLRERIRLVRSDDGGFWSGPRRDVVAFASSDVPLQQSLGPHGAGLSLAGNTRIWADITGARGEATRLFNEEFAQRADDGNAPGLPVLYRIVAPARMLRAAIGNGHIPAEMLSGGVPVINPQGGLFHETAVNRDARYDVQPGEIHGTPTLTGMSGKELRRAAYKSAGVIVAGATGTYASLRWGVMDGGYLASQAVLIKAALAMFGYRAAVGGATDIAQSRLAVRVQRASEEPTGAALDVVQRQVSGWRGVSRGLTRSARDELAFASELLRVNPEDGEAFRRLESASDQMLALTSPLGRALEVLRLASYGINDAAGPRVFANIWLDPKSGLLNVSNASRTFSNLATAAFIPVHWGNNGSALAAHLLGARGARFDRDHEVQAEGARMRGFYRGNADRSALVQWLQGLGDREAVIYPSTLPDGSRIRKPSPVMRVQEQAMRAAAVIGAGPFMLADLAAVPHAFASGHYAAGAADLSKAVADLLFASGYRQSYIDLFRANRGLGATVRQNRLIPWLNAPLRGATTTPANITQPRLVDQGGVDTFRPPVVVAVGMGARVVLGLLVP